MTTDEVLRAALAKCGSKSALARALATTRQAVHCWFSGRRRVSLSRENELRAMLGIEPAVPATPPGTRFCKDCCEYRPLGEFGTKSGPGYRRCRKHVNAYLSKYARYQHSKHGVRRRLNKYGLTLDQYNAMRAAQNYSCAICSRHEREVRSNAKHPDRKLHVDHCHRTGKVRALLCPGCNMRVGIVEASDELLAKTLAYVAKFAGTEATPQGESQP